MVHREGGMSIGNEGGGEHGGVACGRGEGRTP